MKAPAIRALESRPDLRAEEVEAFLAAHEFPLVEGPNVTFVFRGAAESVTLRHWIYGLPSNTEPFHRLGSTDLWFLVMEIPAQSRVEYKFEVESGGRSQFLADPLNPHQARDPYGANSVCYGEGYEKPEWVRADPEAREGTLEELNLVSDVFGGPRPMRVYLPARFRKTRRYPLVIAHDGEDYLRFSDLKIVLDNLIHRLEIPPMIVALTQSPNRLHEYAGDEKHASFLADEIVPLLEDRYPLIGEPHGRCLLGASFGAVSSLYTAWKHPGVFGKLCLQSGSFAFTDIGDHDRGPLFDPVVEFVNAFRAAPGRPAEQIYMSCGTYESLIYYNRSLYPLLSATGMSVKYSESRDGHNWENWRDRLREGLSWLFPGPLWMVYE